MATQRRWTAQTVAQSTVSSAGDAPPSAACVLNPDELTRDENAPVKTTEIQSLISPKI